jgi:AcrR family transcriptional regulator
MDASPTKPIFPRLSSGPRKMDAEQVARNQRGRLQGSMVEAVARHGFADTTLRELVGLAGVSKSTFYEYFEGKQDCFLSTFDDIILEVGERVDNAFDQPGDLRQKMLAGMNTLFRVIADEQGAASLVTVDSLTLGEIAIPYRDRASRRLEVAIQKALDESPSPHRVSALTVRGIVGGIRNCVYHHLRAGEAGLLPAAAEPIVDWILCFDKPPGGKARRGAAVAARESPAPSPGPEPGPAPEETSKRERIVRAAIRLCFENGYETLSIPAISAAAGVSNQTFYEHFAGKQEAFLAGFDLLAEDALRVVAGAVAAGGETERPEAVAAGVRGLLDHAVADELFARMAFFDLPMAGPEALDLADRTLGGFISFLGPADPPEGKAVPPLILEAIGGGTWAVIQHEIAAGHREGLSRLAPEIAEFVIVPFD